MVQTCTDPLEEGLATLFPFAGQCKESSGMTVQQFRVYGKAEQRAGTQACCPQPESQLLCLETMQTRWCHPFLL